MTRLTLLLSIAAAPHIEELAGDTDIETRDSGALELSHESGVVAAPRNVLRSALDAVVMANVQANWTLGDEFAGPDQLATPDNKARAQESRQRALDLSAALKQVASIGESLLEKMTEDLIALTILATPKRERQLTEAGVHQMRSIHIGLKLQKRNQLLDLRAKALAIVANVDALSRESYFTCLERVRVIKASLRDEPDLELPSYSYSTLASILARFEVSGLSVPPYSLCYDVLTTAPSDQLFEFVRDLIRFYDADFCRARRYPQLIEFIAGSYIFEVVSEYLTEHESSELEIALHY